MSNTSKEYVCNTCTYIQSMNIVKCEMCEEPNPYQSKPTEEINSNIGTRIVKCPQCTYNNVGSHVRVCEMCEYEFDCDNTSSKKFRKTSENAEESEQEQDDYDDADDHVDYNDDEFYTSSQSESRNKRPKTIEAVENPMNDDELKVYFDQYLSLFQEQRQQTQLFTDKQLHEIVGRLFSSLQYKNEKPEGQLIFRHCQICFDKDEPVITMKACGHRMICPDDFHQYLVTRIRDGDVLPWIPCPAEVCNVPCDPVNINEDGRLTHAELASFVTTYMFKKLSRNENFITCIHCEKSGFLQFGAPKKEEVVCTICNTKQTIEKGSDGDLDIAFKKMIQAGTLRECPTCRHLTLKEKGLCNVIECVKCGVWWNWRTKEQGHSEKDLKQRARMNGTLWEPGELLYQQELERRNPSEFKALLERNGIKYNPKYVRGGWDEG